MDKFQQMHAFRQVVEAGGFAAAARSLGVSRSSLNKLVIQLENDLGVQLLHRSTRVVRPTETGLAYYDRCVDILNAVAATEQSIQALQELPQGRLRLNAPMSFGTLHLAPILPEFLQRYPNLQVQLTLNDRFVDPIEEGFDLTLRIAEPQPSASLIVKPLAPVQRLLCASPHYLQEQGYPAHPSDLAHHSCLHYGTIVPDYTWTFQEDDREYRVTIQGRLCSNNGEALRAAALRGLGIALLPDFMIASDLQQNQLEPVLAPYTPTPLSLHLLYPIHRHLSTKTQLLVQFLDQHFGQS